MLSVVSVAIGTGERGEKRMPNIGADPNEDRPNLPTVKVAV